MCKINQCSLNLRRTQWFILIHTPPSTKNSVQVFQKKAGLRPQSCSSILKKKFANFFKYEKDFRGSYNICKLLKQC